MSAKTTTPRLKIKAACAAVLLSGATALATASPAMAMGKIKPAVSVETSIVGNDVDVRILGVDLSTSEGAVEVYDILASEAQSACQKASGHGAVLRNLRRDRKCTALLLQEFVNSVDAPTVTAVHAERSAS